MSIGNLTDSLQVSKYGLAPLPTAKGREARRKGSLDQGWEAHECSPLCPLLTDLPLGSSTTSSLNPREHNKPAAASWAITAPSQKAQLPRQSFTGTLGA